MGNRTTTLTSGNDTWDALDHPPLNTNDTVKAGAGDDTVYGWDGKDTLYGGKGDDTLYGENGVDRLYGGKGVDELYGGADGDKFYFANADSGDVFAGKSDTIHDFTDGDKIYLKGSYSYDGTTSGPAEDHYSIWQNGSDYVVSWNSPADSGYHDVVVQGSDPAGDILFYA
jgi:Ca2+-binding RTX toxin-like protein